MKRNAITIRAFKALYGKGDIDTLVTLDYARFFSPPEELGKRLYAFWPVIEGIHDDAFLDRYTLYFTDVQPPGIEPFRRVVFYPAESRGATVAVDIDDMRYEDRYSVFTVRKEAHLSLRTDDIAAVHGFMNGFLESAKRKKK